MPEDRIQREIEDILSRLDDLPEDRIVPFRRRPFNATATLGRLLEPLARISVRQVMLAALILIFVGFVGARVNPVLGRWVLIAGVILFLTSFALSFLHRGPGAPATDRRWRGRPLDLREPGPGDRLRAWFRKRGQRRY